MLATKHVNRRKPLSLTRAYELFLSEIRLTSGTEFRHNALGSFRKGVGWVGIFSVGNREAEMEASKSISLTPHAARFPKL